METVIRITEENHGFIGIVKSVKDVIPYLVNEDWINERTTLPLLDDKKRWCNIPLKNLFGEDWIKALSSMSLDVLSEIFNGGFYFSVEKVYCAEPD